MTSTELRDAKPEGGELPPDTDAARRTGRRGTVGSVLHDHWPLVLVLVAGGLVRLVTDLSYSALMTPDSWTYTRLAFGGSPVGFAADRPSGYALVLKVLSLGGRSLDTVTFVQHLAGLATATLVYFLLRRLDVPRWAATIATAVVGLDSYAVTLIEESIMSETMFVLCITASAYLATVHRRRAWALAAAGALLGLAATARTMAVFAIPVFVVYALCSAPRWRGRVVAVAAVALPLLAYSVAQGAATGYFGLTQGDGWFLYGRVASIMSCGPASVPPQTRFLCDTAGEHGKARGLTSAAGYTFLPTSPARQRFGAMGAGTVRQRRQASSWLRQWAVAVMVARPGTYLAGVGKDFSKYLHPPWSSLAGVWILRDPSERFFPGFSRMTPPQRRYMTELRNAYLPGYVRVVDPPPFLPLYQDWLEMPGWLFTYLALFSLVVLTAAAAVRRTFPHSAEAIFVLGAALTILVGAVASSQYQDRFVPSVLPLLVVGITLAAYGLSRRVRRASGAQLSRKAA